MPPNRVIFGFLLIALVKSKKVNVTNSCWYNDDLTHGTCTNIDESVVLKDTLDRLTFDNFSKVVSPSLIENAPNLTFLQFRRSRIANVTNGAFGGLQKLLFLVFLDNNIVPDFSEAMFEGASEHLSWLSVINNKNSFEETALHNLKNLTWLHVQNQNLSRLSGVFLKNLTNLHELVIHNCGLTDISSDAFDTNANLEILSLNFNKLTGIRNATWKNLKKLKILELHHNHFTNFDLGQFRDLKSVKIAGFPSVFFRNIDNPAKLFEMFPNLQEIEVKKRDMRSNETKTLLQELRRRRIHIIGTPHDCHLPPFFFCHKPHKIAH